jgi:hypothetical protein
MDSIYIELVIEHFFPSLGLIDYLGLNKAITAYGLTLNLQFSGFLKPVLSIIDLIWDLI